MEIQIDFEKPYEISQEEEKNFIQLKVYETSLFKRASDGLSVE